MKANELMIGDWVKTTSHGEEANVAEILKQGILTQHGWILLYDEILPIPLTPEILEKNGWHKYDTYYHILELANGASLWFCWFDSSVELQWQGIDVWLGNRATEINFRSIGILYVHKLQQALRLCGIDKEIVL